MKTSLKLALTIGVFLGIVGCAGFGRPGTETYTGFVDLPFPSDSYAAGQVVEVYSMPRKVEVSFDPEIPWDQITSSDGWDITAGTTNQLASNISGQVVGILSGSAGYSGKEIVKVKFSEVKTFMLPKNRIFKALSEALRKDQSTITMINAYMRTGTHYDVVTQLLRARVEISVVSESGAELRIDSATLEKINTTVSGNFKFDGTSSLLVSGTPLIVAFHYDPKMLPAVLSTL